MSVLRASAYLCWLLAVLGVVMRWSSLSSMAGYGGVLSYRAYAVLSVLGLGLASISSVAAVGLHVAELFSWSRVRSARRRGERLTTSNGRREASPWRP